MIRMKSKGKRPAGFWVAPRESAEYRRERRLAASPVLERAGCPGTARNTFPKRPGPEPVANWTHSAADSLPSEKFRFLSAPDRVAVFRGTGRRTAVPRPHNAGWSSPARPTPSAPRYSPPAIAGSCSTVQPQGDHFDAYQSPLEICYASISTHKINIINNNHDGNGGNVKTASCYA